MSDIRPFRRSQTDYYSTPTASSLQHLSSTSTQSHRYVNASNIGPRAGLGDHRAAMDHAHRRGASETGCIGTIEVSDENLHGSPHASDHIKNARRSLRPLPQAPGPTMLPTSKHSRSHTMDILHTSTDHASCSPAALDTRYEYLSSSPIRADSPSPRSSPSTRPRPHHAHTSSQLASLTGPDLQQLQKSATGHFKTLSKMARNAETDDFAMTLPTPSVVGLQGRRQLKRTESNRPTKTLSKSTGSAWEQRNWMDKQRQFLQAYEYLCHIGEAKEWIEDIIQQPIPPIIELEEALRDGVTLAEVVQALKPEQSIKIFQHSKLQYRHSDNIASFFRFLEEVELPDLFKFELIDLYEKKNIPKVIYCIHALSWLLFRKGLVDFRIGNLVGQLQFEHHELEQTQKGLDKSGVNMPSFSGVGAKFGIESGGEPEPSESEEERRDRELSETGESINDLQSQMRGALLRLRLGHTMNDLWNTEEELIGLQSRIRGEFAREIIRYRLRMRRFATNLQSAARGYIFRLSKKILQDSLSNTQCEVLELQSIIRARASRSKTSQSKTLVLNELSAVLMLQACIRAKLLRKSVSDDLQACRGTESKINGLQAIIRGMQLRKDLNASISTLSLRSKAISNLQGFARGFISREKNSLQVHLLHSNSALWIMLQAQIRGKLLRTEFQSRLEALATTAPSIRMLQAASRASQTRLMVHDLLTALSEHHGAVLGFQCQARGTRVRTRITALETALYEATKVVRQFQSMNRAALLRMRIAGLLDVLNTNDALFVQLQALARAMLLRSKISSDLTNLEIAEESVLDLQALARGCIVRKGFEEKQQFFRQNMEKVVKIQSIVRAKIQGQAYKSLTSGKNPPVGTLKGFVHLLNDSDFDFEEEIEFERLRKLVVSHVRQNELADQYISQLDIKIALLVKNKITLDEVVKHQRHFGGHIGTLLPNADISSKDPFDLRALNKTSRTKLEHYQELFFLLQTQPHYLARLFRRLREQSIPEKECEKIKHLMMGLFGYAQKRREEYYLVKLMARSIKEEVEGSLAITEWTRCNPLFNKLFNAYTKSPRDRKFMRDVLGPIVKENIIDNIDLDLESDPMQIYLSAINNEELRTGERSRRRREVRREEAIRDPETRATFIAHLQDLRDIADSFFVALEELLHSMPFGVRYVGQQMFQCLRSKFPDEDQGYCLQVVGQWLWRSYFLPALIEPEKSGIVDRGLTQEQKKNLAEISKVLGQISAGRLFGGENVYLQPLNSYITDSIQRLGDIWHNMLSVEDAETHFDIGEFNDLYAKTKPTLYIKMADIFSLHHFVASEAASICPNQDDILREILRELGSVKSNESELMGVSSSEISLTLTPKLHTVEDPDAEVKALFMETKRCILYIIRVQSGANLMEIMVKSVSSDDDARWDLLVRDELSNNSRRRGAYTDAHNLVDISTMSYAALKRMSLENILQLERIGRISRHNHYQDLLNDIATDIRTKHRRRIQRHRELEGVRMTLARLNDQAVYLEQQLRTYNDYIEQAMVTLQNKKGKKRFLMPFTKQWDHERELQRSGRVFKFGSFKYSARNLADRGVLVQWMGFNERQWDKVDLTISSNAVGIFTIEGSSANMMIPGANAQVPLDDLLQAQFNNTQFIDFFEGALRVNVNLFLHLIMKKFYNE